MVSYAPQLISPEQYLRLPDGDEAVLPGSQFLLAQGDSWFSIGAIPPTTTNLLMEMRFSQHTCIVNCARPGKLLTHMADWHADTLFMGLLGGVYSTAWPAILLSGGGNDLIDAVNVLPRHADGSPVPVELRLLLLPAERSGAGDVSRYVSQPGWEAFAAYLGAQFDLLIACRDGAKSQNRGTPVILHLYDYPTARNAPAATFPMQSGPWLYPALLTYQVPPQDWTALVKLLIDRLAGLLVRISGRYSNVVVVDTRGTLVAAAPGTTGRSNGWENEIHPTQGGYARLADKYGDALAEVQAHPEAAFAMPQAEMAAPERRWRTVVARAPH